MSLIDQTKPIKAPDLPDEALRRMKHADWLSDFSMSLQATRLKRGAMVTPFLEGAITKLQWAANYIRLLKKDNLLMARDNKLLRKHIEHLGGIPAPAFKLDVERAADDAAVATEALNEIVKQHEEKS